MTDKGYDSQANRMAARARGITPVIPRRENAKQRGRFFPKRLYKLRARIEPTIGKRKRFKRVAMRCEKTDIGYWAIIGFACGMMPIKSLYTAWAGVPIGSMTALTACLDRENQPYPAQQESLATSFSKPSAASFNPSTVVR